ncbi:NUDIX domain-containing protein [Alkalibacillus haloalkaliphilus]|uniref:NUDIX domain-containing protein n=1 Tax=Alkalibacillus haloalkaliphilus TaxID=94136 RepID=UPI002935E5A4|nr:NUDIX domain-containing protein [Alkalibacillus haloalkaliphilus]MDV2581586.1 NUDIX domain-containing protein [Alkalibacillus haloalkaliphilus]
MKYCSKCGELLNLNQGNESRAKKICPHCNWKWYSNPVPVVVVLVTTEKGDIVYARQEQYPKGVWSLVSGFVDKGENAEAAAIREVKEETGLDTKVEEYMGSIVSKDKPDDIYLMFHCKVTGGELQAGDDADEVKIAPVSTDELVTNSIAEKMVINYSKATKE